jgi:hypothetical protein
VYVNAKMIPVNCSRDQGRGNGGEKWKRELKYDVFDIL